MGSGWAMPVSVLSNGLPVCSRCLISCSFIKSSRSPLGILPCNSSRLRTTLSTSQTIATEEGVRRQIATIVDIPSPFHAREPLMHGKAFDRVTLPSQQQVSSSVRRRRTSRRVVPNCPLCSPRRGGRTKTWPRRGYLQSLSVVAAASAAWIVLVRQGFGRRVERASGGLPPEARRAKGGADDGNRTRTIRDRGILSPLRLPIPPRPQASPFQMPTGSRQAMFRGVRSSAKHDSVKRRCSGNILAMFKMRDCAHRSR